MINILIAEDNKDLRTIFTRVFSRPPFLVSAVEDGQEVINHLQKAQPDVIILDINMPNVSGLEVLTYLRDNPGPKKAKVIVVTGNHLTQYREEAELADMFLIKPVDVFVLTKFAERLAKNGNFWPVEGGQLI